jgi:hypothetical protein
LSETEQLNVELNEILETEQGNLVSLTERLTDLELALEDQGWLRLGFETEQEFSREGLTRICQLARIAYLKNPLIQRGVNAQVYYVFGQGMNISAKDEAINEVVQGFLDDAKNKAELTIHQARMYKEQDLQVEGNIFFCFFTNKETGRVRIRTIPVDEVLEIIKNPEDSKDPWYYKRSWGKSELKLETGMSSTTPQVAYYPDWRYRPKSSERPKTIGNKNIEWDSPVYHVRVGGLGRMSFGISEVYAAIDWARAYKDFLENWSTIVQAYARFAWRVSGIRGGTGSAAAVEAVKRKFESTLPTGVETNPPPLTASTLIEPGSIRMDPIRTAGATTSADDGRRLLLMVAAATGLPETFFGDTSVGTLATAKSLDRPTELMMVSRQTLWADIHRDIIGYVLARAVEAKKLVGSVTEEEDGTPHLEFATGVDPSVKITFPPILEHDVASAVDAVVKAATLSGQVPAGTLDMPTITRMLLTALGEEDIDAMIEQLYPAGETVAETRLVAAVKELQEAVRDAGSS